MHPDKLAQAIAILEDLYGNMSRPLGFTRSMSKEDVLALMERSEFQWDAESERWINIGLSELVRAEERNLDIALGTLLDSMIYSDEFPNAQALYDIERGESEPDKQQAVFDSFSGTAPSIFVPRGQKLLVELPTGMLYISAEVKTLKSGRVLQYADVYVRTDLDDTRVEEREPIGFAKHLFIGNILPDGKAPFRIEKLPVDANTYFDTPTEELNQMQWVTHLDNLPDYETAEEKFYNMCVSGAFRMVDANGDHIIETQWLSDIPF